MNLSTEQSTDLTLTPAERLYLAHTRAVKKYQQTHPDKCKEKAKRFYNKIREDPELLVAQQAKRRKYYLEVIVPKRQAERETKIKTE